MLAPRALGTQLCGCGCTCSGPNKDTRPNSKSVRVVHVDLDTWQGMPERLERALLLAATCLLEGNDILIHCRHGIHRSGSFCIFLMSLLRLRHSSAPHVCWTTLLDQDAKYFADHRQLPWRKARESRQAVTDFDWAFPEEAARKLALSIPAMTAKDLEAKTCQDHQRCFWVQMWIGNPSWRFWYVLGL
jgi:hypothetical protein